MAEPWAELLPRSVLMFGLFPAYVLALGLAVYWLTLGKRDRR